MFATIVVPLDGSPFAEQVLPLAATVARRSGMPVELVKVHRRNPVGYGEHTMLAALDIAGRGRALTDEYLRRIAEALAASTAVRVCKRLLDDPSSTAEAICSEAERVNAAMIAMTTHGRTGLVRAVRGSVADGVLRHARIPVLLWRPAGDDVRTDAAWGSEEPLATHVLVALDGSAWAESVLAAAASLASVLDARVTLLQVVAPVRTVGRPFVPVPVERPYAGGGVAASSIDRAATQRAAERAHARIANVLGRLRIEHPHLVVGGIVVTEDVASEAILRVARDVGADLVAMTTHGRGASRLVVGSTVDHVVAGRTGATLLMRPSAADAPH